MKKRPFLLQIAPGHRSVRCNTDLPPSSHSELFLQVLVWSSIASNFDKGWRRDHKHKIMDIKGHLCQNAVLCLEYFCNWL